jgi:hypothetical protein
MNDSPEYAGKILPQHNLPLTEIFCGAEQGLLAGSPLSPLLGVLYLLPLNKKMEAFCSKDGGQYWRYMDDFVIFARTRHQLKKAIKQVYRTLDQLTLKVHPDKRDIGRTNKGFDFLG